MEDDDSPPPPPPLEDLSGLSKKEDTSKLPSNQKDTTTNEQLQKLVEKVVVSFVISLKFSPEIYKAFELHCCTHWYGNLKLDFYY
jgi:hypothetical protein